jgi:hypothetical protein
MSDDRRWNRIQQYLANGQPVAARVALEALLQRDPARAEAHLVLSNIAWMDDRVRDAARHALDAARLLSAGPKAITCEVVEALLKVGEIVAARACLERIESSAISDGTLLVRLAALRMQLGEHATSLALLDRAALAGADDTNFHYQRGLELTYNGRLEEAEVEHHAALRVDPAFGPSSLALSRLRRQTAQSNHLEAWAERIQQTAAGSDDRISLEFARYKELEDLGRHDEAWQALAAGNALKYARQHYDARHAWELFDSLIKRCTPDLLQPENVHFDGPQPIFIIGMPRSGTTLLDRMLGNHSQVTSAGELDDFGRQLRWAANHRITLDEQIVQHLPELDYAETGRRYLAQTQWRAKGARFFIDKLPRNWMIAGLIRRALPQARILHLVREPMDVCFSNFRALLGDAFAYSYDLDALAAHYLQYRRVVAHWHRAMPGQILDVPYGELVSDPETSIRRVFSFCGLDWEPGCTDLARNTSAVATLSMAQVREPVHTRSFEEWRPYERQLASLRKAITA